MHFDKTLEEKHLRIASENTKALYFKLKRSVLSIADDIEPYTSEKKYVGFNVSGRRIAIFQIHTQHIYIWLQLKPHELKDPADMARKYDTHCSLKVVDDENIGYVTDLIRQSYLKNKEYPRKTKRV
jgi:predicted transport protein